MKLIQLTQRKWQARTSSDDISREAFQETSVAQMLLQQPELPSSARTGRMHSRNQRSGPGSHVLKTQQRSDK
jgi:hypothetical protein